MTTNKLGITLGELIAQCEAALTEEAVDILAETGLTPRRLLAQRDELLEACKEVTKRVAAVAESGGSFQDFLSRGSCSEIMEAIAHADAQR